jgi:ATP-dependent Clp protease ATP-binding subunit ClpA
VAAEDIAKVIAEKTGVPVTSIQQEESEKLLRLESEIHKRVIGQDEAVKAVAAAMRRARAELRSPNRPIANFLFLGPTGVGKTQLAKTLASVYFGSEDAMLRFDMSEFQEVSSIDRFIGTLDQPGILTEAVKNKAFSLLLLDEIEKAHRDILNLFLQVMDDGRLTSGQGEVVDFTNVILIATSNAATPFIQDRIKAVDSIDQIKTALMESELKKYFTPEFLNRFDDIIVFKPLTQDEIREIAKLLLLEVAGQLLTRGINLKVTPEALEELALAGFDPAFGARPLRRVIQERVNNVLANYLLQNKLGRRDAVVLETGGTIRVEKARAL